MSARAQARAVLPHTLPLRFEPYTLTLYMPDAPAGPGASAAAGACAPAPGVPVAGHPTHAPQPHEAGGGGSAPATAAQAPDPGQGQAGGPACALKPSPLGLLGDAERCMFLVPADDALAADAAELQRRAEAAAAEQLAANTPPVGELEGGSLQLVAVPAAHAAAPDDGPGAGGDEAAGAADLAALAGSPAPAAERRRLAQRLPKGARPPARATGRQGGAGRRADPIPGGVGGLDGRPLRDRAHKLQAWFGADAFVLLEPGSFSRVCLDEQVWLCDISSSLCSGPALARRHVEQLCFPSNATRHGHPMYAAILSFSNNACSFEHY